MAKGKFRMPEQQITDGVIWKQLLLFFFPILLGSFFQQLYNTVDAIVVGKALGKEALSAVGSTGSLIDLLIGFFTGLASGATVVIAQYCGANDRANLKKSIHTGTLFALLTGAFLTVFGYVLAPQLLQMMRTPADIMVIATDYIRTMFLGMIPMVMYNIGSGILRAMGDSRRPLYYLIVASVVNIILDVILVMGLQLGVNGAAWATILAQAISGVLVLVTLNRLPKDIRLQTRDMRLTGRIVRKIVAIGLPGGIQSVMYSISNVIIQASINNFGTDTVAAATAFNKVASFQWMLLNAFGVAATTFAGQNFGAGKIDRVKRSIWVCTGMTGISAVFVSAMMMLFWRPLLGMFVTEEQVMQIGRQILFTVTPFYVTYIFVETLAGAMRGVGQAIIPTIITFFGICVIRVIWLLFIAPGIGTVEAVFWSYPMTWTITSAAFLIYYAGGSWLRKAMKQRELDA